MYNESGLTEEVFNIWREGRVQQVISLEGGRVD